MEHRWKIGDMVTWESQANGVKLRKSGTVVGIVPPNVSVWNYIEAHAALYTYNFARISGDSGARQVESVLVVVPMRTKSGKEKRRQMLYWPDMRGMRRTP